MKILLLLCLSISVFASGSSYKKDSKDPKYSVGERPEKRSSSLVTFPSRDLLLGKVLKSAVENYHFSRLRLDNKISKRAFKIYIERLDYSKRYLLQKDVDILNEYQNKMDDQVENGQLSLVTKSSQIRNKRLAQVKKYTEEILKKKFDFSKKESFELDPKKRKFAKTDKELKEIWRKTLKLDALNRYVSYIEEREEWKKNKGKKKDKKKKDKKKVKPPEKLTAAQMEKKAREATAKSYKRIFKRKMNEDHSDELSRFYNSITMSFDPHTTYFAPKEKDDFDIDIRGSLEGIGAVLREDGEYIKVVEIVPGSASWKQGDLKAEDSILKVGQGAKEAVDIVGMPLEDAVRLIRGPKGSTVKLTIKKSDGAIATVPIVRDTVIIEESYAKSGVIEDKKHKKKIGYIHLPKFYRDFSKSFFDKTARSCTEDVRKAVRNLKAKNVDGIVLDLRMNGGGSLDDAVQMSGLFVKSGPIVQVKSSEGKIRTLKDMDSNVEYDGPLIVMVNKFSASASEILAGALQDYKRAVIVGSSATHGKGTVQSIIDLDQAISTSMGIAPLGSIKVTVSKFYRINGHSTQYKGVTPDIILPDPQDYIKTGEKSLDFSLPWDEIKPSRYSLYNKKFYDLKKLNKISKKRVKASKDFKKISDLSNFLEKRRDDTIVNLNLKERRKEDKSYKKITEKFKNEDEAKWIGVKLISDSKAVKDAKKDKKYAEELKKKEEEFSKQLRTDVQLQEVLYIFEDMKKNKKVKVAQK